MNQPSSAHELGFDLLLGDPAKTIKRIACNGCRKSHLSCDGVTVLRASSHQDGNRDDEQSPLFSDSFQTIPCSLGRYVAYHEEEGQLKPDTTVKETIDLIRKKMRALCRFVNSEQKESLHQGFQQQLQVMSTSAHHSDTPTIIWDRSMTIHYYNQSAHLTLGLTCPLPCRDDTTLLRVFSPPMAQMIRRYIHQSYLEQKSDSVFCRSKYGRADCIRKEGEEYRMCNFVLSVKRDLLMLPQLFILQIQPDPLTEESSVQ
ncbi:hypothetical protein PROFUN_01383 [Planoprotostelium fungivorum]|uniref:PAS domain-containing protein n=1 Tax=Planoprotostelium fungivorum TaxID=1890364 RepID=A0A2P6NT53_9EUKA|nr:hypothetical protein PROFUN_01383 [Planoprotostelium fungivorum]